MIPLKGLDPQVSLTILNIATNQTLHAFSSQNFLLQTEYALTLLLLILRRLNNNHTLPLFNAFMPQHLNHLLEILFKIPTLSTADYEEECTKYLILIEDLLLSLHFIGYYKSGEVIGFIQRFL